MLSPAICPANYVLEAFLPEQAHFAHPADLRRTCKVGSYQPNRLGLYDMHGNVFEWCDDAEPTANGAMGRAYRNGSWWVGPQECRAARRRVVLPSYRVNTLGLRVARVPK